jgi:hypothetical protein
MKTFRIPYTYQMGGVVEVKAETLEQAKDLAIELSVNNAHNEHYLDDSFQVVDNFCKEVEE